MKFHWTLYLLLTIKNRIYLDISEMPLETDAIKDSKLSIDKHYLAPCKNYAISAFRGCSLMFI